MGNIYHDVPKYEDKFVYLPAPGIIQTYISGQSGGFYILRKEDPRYRPKLTVFPHFY